MGVGSWGELGKVWEAAQEKQVPGLEPVTLFSLYWAAPTHGIRTLATLQHVRDVKVHTGTWHHGRETGRRLAVHGPTELVLGVQPHDGETSSLAHAVGRGLLGRRRQG